MTPPSPRPLLYAALMEALPAEWPPLPRLSEDIRREHVKVVVVDDDPTGTQSVAGVHVITTWSVDDILHELVDSSPAVYVLTNSRSLTPARAREVNLQVGRNLVAGARVAGRRYVVVSRSDSTLRGHFPLELVALAEGLGARFDGCLLIPFFEEGGRYTVDDVHYVRDGEVLVPAAETNFARDPVFGYRSSNLRDWVEEKTQGKVRAENVASLSLTEIRTGGPAAATERLMRLQDGQVCVVNVASRSDLDVLVAGLLKAEQLGRRFLYRTAASFVPVRSGLVGPLLLDPKELGMVRGPGGLIVVGSYISRTTTQLDAVLLMPGVIGIPVDARQLAASDGSRAGTETIARAAEQALAAGRDVVVYTTRELLSGEGNDANFAIQARISAGLIALIRQIRIQPRYLLAKGGITSSDLLTHALGATRALVMGQLLPGVSVLRIESPATRAGLPYIVFPGNVGESGALAEAVRLLRTET